MANRRRILVVHCLRVFSAKATLRNEEHFKSVSNIVYSYTTPSLLWLLSLPIDPLLLMALRLLLQLRPCLLGSPATAPSSPTLPVAFTRLRMRHDTSRLMLVHVPTPAHHSPLSICNSPLSISSTDNPVIVPHCRLVYLTC